MRFETNNFSIGFAIKLQKMGVKLRINCTKEYLKRRFSAGVPLHDLEYYLFFNKINGDERETMVKLLNVLRDYIYKSSNDDYKMFLPLSFKVNIVGEITKEQISDMMKEKDYESIMFVHYVAL